MILRDFRIGDHVRLIKNQDHRGAGMTGTIIDMSQTATIQFDEKPNWPAHDGDIGKWNDGRECIKGKNGWCWFVGFNKLELAYEQLQYDPSQQGDTDDDI